MTVRGFPSPADGSGGAGHPLPALAGQAHTSGPERRASRELLGLAIEAHGGMDRWSQLSTFRATASITGHGWAPKARLGLLADVLIDGETAAQRLRIAPFPEPGSYATWDGDDLRVEATMRPLLDQRRDPGVPFARMTGSGSWDDLRVAEVASATIWNSLVSPFLFTDPAFVTEETEPWWEDGEVWRRLLVTHPPTTSLHARRQTLSFGPDGLLRRVDRTIDILGQPVVEYASLHQSFNGIMVPTRRRVHLRDVDGGAIRDSLVLSIHLPHVRFS